MSIASNALAETAISGQAGTSSAKVRKPPPKRSITAKADTTELPEPR